MKGKSYEYYAKFEYAEDGITLTFPDLLGCITCGYHINEALRRCFMKDCYSNSCISFSQYRFTE